MHSKREINQVNLAMQKNIKHRSRDKEGRNKGVRQEVKLDEVKYQEDLWHHIW